MVVAMSSSVRPVRLPVFVAAATVSALALAACSGGSDNAATSTATSTTSSTAATTSSPTSTATSTSTSASPSTTTTTASSTTSTSTTSATPKPTSTTATQAPPTTKFINACVTANSKLNSAVSQWNAAVASGSDSKLDAAAKNFRTVGGILIDLRTDAWDRQFSLDAQAIATELNAMADARQNNQTVSTTTFNTKVTALRTYCQSRLKS